MEEAFEFYIYYDKMMLTKVIYMLQERLIAWKEELFSQKDFQLIFLKWARPLLRPLA